MQCSWTITIPPGEKFTNTVMMGLYAKPEDAKAFLYETAEAIDVYVTELFETYFVVNIGTESQAVWFEGLIPGLTIAPFNARRSAYRPNMPDRF